MKKQLPLILAAAGIVFIIVVAAVVYKLYFGATADRAAGTPQPGPVGSQRGPSPRPQNTPAAVKAGGTAAPATVQQGANEKTVPSIEYEYDAKGRRDPFAALVQKPSEKKKGPIPLENYEVTEFKLTGILWSNSEFYAVVLAPDSRSYIVNKGKKIGLHGGTVYKIMKDSVIVRELLKDYMGFVKPKDTVLKLRREEEG